MQGNVELEMEGNVRYVAVHCAYCEDLIRSANGKHVEHFRRKNKTHGFPELTFTWNNLFLSCESPRHCGHYKDRPGGDSYNPDDLVKPDEDEPDKYLYFHSNGEVRPRVGIDSTAKYRAEETIRVFNLNEPALRGQRGKIISGFLKNWGAKTDFLALLESYPSFERASFIADELNKAQWHAYPSVLRHFLARRG
jgi:uncharacterized protein (TIGR02646 family)